MKSISLIFSMFALLMLGACSNEYGSSDLSVSDSGKFVERGTNDALDGSVVITKDAGTSLVVEFEQGYPNGRVEMQNSEGEVVLNSSFVPDQNRELGGGFGSAFINETLEKGAAKLATDDYLSLFKEFSKFNGDYFEIDGNSKKIEGQYDAGERMGRWQIYCKNGQLESDRTYARKTNEAGSELTIEIGDARVNTCDGSAAQLPQGDIYLH